MKRFIITRNFPGVSKMTTEQLDEVGAHSESVLQQMRKEGMQIEQEQSYAAGDQVFYVYNADSEELIMEHSKRGSFPVDSINEVSSILKHNTNQ